MFDRKQGKDESKRIKYKRIHKIEFIETEVDTYDIENFESGFFIGEANFLCSGFVVHNSKHAGGICLFPKPIYNYIPIERAGGGLVTAYPESGQVSTLDDLGVIKLDILSITVLDNIKETIYSIDEDLYLIEEDGIEKVVPHSYLLGKEVVW